jgi:general secretion pathway protein A
VSQQVPFISYDASRFKSTHTESLTYEAYYGLKEKPFSLSANPRFLYRSKSHAAAYDDLMTAIRRREGLIVMTGEIGAGKTTLCRAVLENLGRKTFSAFVADPFLSREDLLKTLLIDFGIMSVDDLKSGRLKGASRTDLSYPLYEFLDSLAPLDAVAVAVIDEAQNLSLPLLEEVRILADLEGREKLLQVVLVGQPELRDYLKLPEMRQVDQRVTLRCEVAPLDREGVTHYVNHRLSVASGGTGAVQFSPDALDAIYLAAGGVPRLINLICDRALQMGYLARTDLIERQVIESAAARLGVAIGPAAAPAPVTATAHQSAQPIPEPPSVSEPLEDPTGTRLVVASTESHGLESFESEKVVVAPLPPAGSMPMLAGTALVGGLVAMAAAGAWLFQAVADAAGDPLVPPLPTSPLSRSVRELKSPAPVAVPGVAAALRAAQDTPSGTVRTMEAETTAPYVIQVASFHGRERADEMLDELSRAGYRAYLVETDMGTEQSRVVQVLAGWYSTRELAQADLARIKAMPGYADARIRGTARPGVAPQR